LNIAICQDSNVQCPRDILPHVNIILQRVRSCQQSINNSNRNSSANCTKMASEGGWIMSDFL